MGHSTADSFESEAAAWEQVARATVLAESGTDDPRQAAQAAREAAAAWTAAAEATERACAR